jgi:peptidyl-tRNA hydrolase, PTH1 family
MAMKLIAALGNHEAQYAATRHNLAWMLLAALPGAGQLAWQNKFKGQYAAWSPAGERLIVLKPHTFMNLSGESIGAALQFFKLGPADLVVIHDDLELAFGSAAFKSGGGLGGHNGLRSIVQHAGTPDFYRLRLGIGRPSHGNISSYVLSRFGPDEQIALPQFLEGCASLLAEILAKPLAKSVGVARRFVEPVR